MLCLDSSSPAGQVSLPRLLSSFDNFPHVLARHSFQGVLLRPGRDEGPSCHDMVNEVEITFRLYSKLAYL